MMVDPLWFGGCFSGHDIDDLIKIDGIRQKGDYKKKNS